MNKSAIRNFAVWARAALLETMRQQLGSLGIMPDAIKKPLPVSTSEIEYFDLGTDTPLSVEGDALHTRQKIVARLTQDEQEDYPSAYQHLAEQLASTWFNRLVAIRYMEVNDYFPDQLRTLSSAIPGKVDPDLVSSPFSSDFDFTEAEETQIYAWQDHNQQEALFNFLLLKRCHQMGKWMPDFFESNTDVTDFFLHFNYIDPNGVIYRLTHDIPEEDFQNQVQVIGWLYQYYNSELKDEVFAKLKKNIKVTKHSIPAATQLFTPDWIVRYMVENSLGRLWLLGHPNPELQAKWHYYLPSAPQEEKTATEVENLKSEYAKLTPEDLTLIDPCSGSGHVLAYAFDVLMDIYRAEYYEPAEAVECILTHNLYGLDIDRRAYQLTYFALMMKARQYDRNFFRRHLRPHVCAIEESNGLKKWRDIQGQAAEEEQMTLTDTFVDLADYVIDTFHDAQNYGSLLSVKEEDYDGLLDYLQQLQEEGGNLFLSAWLEENAEKMPKLIAQAKLLSKKYWCCVTNPPYLGSGSFNTALTKFAKKNFPVSKSDMFAMFIEKCSDFLCPTGFQAMITQHAWMFLSSYEKLRQKIQKKTIINMAHLGPRAFEEIGGEVVQTTSFVLENIHIPDYQGTYCRLIAANSQDSKEKMFLNGENRFIKKSDEFSKIPGTPIAYSMPDKLIQLFTKTHVSDFCMQRMRISTGNNDYFLRLWHEINNHNLFYPNKWIPFSKGGTYRKWFGNWWYVLNYENDGAELKRFSGFSGGNDAFYLKEGLVWTDLSTGKISFRYLPEGAIACSAGPMIHFNNKNTLYYLQAFLNSNVANEYIKVLCLTLHFQWGDIAKIPVIYKKDYLVNIKQITKKNISLSKADWDSFETSWDFQTHPLVSVMQQRSSENLTLADCYDAYKQSVNERFDQLQANETELNRIFIEIYGLAEELTPEVADKDITVHRLYDTKEDVPPSMQGSKYILTKEDVIKSLLSYAVGCLFGRYSLDMSGLAYAGDTWDAANYETFIPDNDNVVPLTDEEYFDDDLVSFIGAWLKKAFGREHFVENLAFITDALGTKGTTPKDKLRTYFLKHFYKDHCQTYQKRPIYWLFDSGKENGFKAFVYLHRWNKDTEGRVLLYLHKVQKKYETELRAIAMNMDTVQDKRRLARLEKRQDHLRKQLAEVKDYDEKLDHLAGEHLNMDLDDGVKVNYEKMQIDREGKKYTVLAKVK